MAKNDCNNYAEAIVQYLKDQHVEVYCGDSGETSHFSDTESTQKNIIRGKIMESKGDCLVLEVTKSGHTGLVYLNAWAIKSIVPYDQPLFIKDVYNDEEFGFPKGKR